MQGTHPDHAATGQSGFPSTTAAGPEKAPPGTRRKRRAARQPSYGLKLADQARARAAMQLLFGVRVHHCAGVRKLCCIIVRHRGGAVPMDRLAQVRMVQRFVEMAAPAPDALHDCSLPMPPLKTPGVAMRDAMRRAREYHAPPGWFERYGRCGVPRVMGAPRDATVQSQEADTQAQVVQPETAEAA